MLINYSHQVKVQSRAQVKGANKWWLVRPPLVAMLILLPLAIMAILEPVRLAEAQSQVVNNHPVFIDHQKTIVAPSSSSSTNKQQPSPLRHSNWTSGHLQVVAGHQVATGVGPRRPAAQLLVDNQPRATIAGSGAAPARAQPQLAGSGQQLQRTAAHNSSLAAVRQRWRQMERSIGESLASFGAQLKLTIMEMQLQHDQHQVGNKQVRSISVGCKQALVELVDGLGLQQQKLWASQIVDASARLPSGLLEGTLTELGNFDQCLAINYQLAQGERPSSADYSGSGSRWASGQYCSLQIKPPLTQRPRLHTVCQPMPALSATNSNYSSQGSNEQRLFRVLSQNSHQFYYVGLRLGICTPSKCSQSDIQHLLTAYLAKYELLGQVKSCQVAATTSSGNFSTAIATTTMTDSLRLDFVQQCIVSSFVALLVLSALGTFLDYFTPENKFTATKTTTTTTPKANAANKMSIGGGCRNSNETMQSMTLGSLDYQNNLHAVGQRDERVHGKRWHYQVYRDACEHYHSPGLQRNPIAELTMDGRQTMTKPGASHELLLVDNKRLAEDDCLEESWIAQLERNQAEAMSAAEAAAVALRRQKQQQQRRRYRWRRFIVGFLVCFSLRRSLKAIGRHQQVNSGHQQVVAKQEIMSDIRVIHGLRSITMIWIIFGHTIGLVNPEMMNNLFSLAQLSCSSRLLQALLNATLAVNTFFMVSGLVTVVSFARKCKSALVLLINDQDDLDKSKSFQASKQKRHRTNSHHHLDAESSSVDSSSMVSSLSSSASSNRCIGGRRTTNATSHRSTNNAKKCEKKGVGDGGGLSATSSTASGGWPSDFQPLLWLLMRYLRLTPAYAAIIGFSILLPALGSGPFWQESVGQMGPTCRQNWWLNVLYVNNFIGTDKLCLIHSWYLSNDWQFFTLTLLLFALFYKSRKFTILLMITLAVASTATTFALTVLNEFPPTIVTTSPAVAERWLFIHSLYYKPWPHLTSYLVGLVVGYLILIKERLTMSTALRTLCWILFTLVSLSLLNSIYPWNMGLQVEPLLTGLHSATFRTLWAICFAWLVFALVTKPENPLARLLSWHGFQITSRLTYCAYLVHPLIIYHHFGTLRERMDSSMYGQFHRFVATLGLSYLFALILSLLVETPSIQVQHFLANLGGDGGEEEEAANGRLGRSTKTTTDSSTANSWTATSSFGEQTPGSAMPRAESFKVLREDQSLSMHNGGKTNNLPERHERNGDATSIDCTSPHVEQHGTTGATQTSRLDFITADHRQPQVIQPAPPTRTSTVAAAAAESSIALDADFQKKLAQAISRGFRIRSRIANGTLRQAAAAAGTKRATQIKRLPTGAHQLDIAGPMFAGTGVEQQAASKDGSKLMNNGEQDAQVDRQQQQHSNKRGEFCSTFVTSNGKHNHHFDQSYHAQVNNVNRRLSHDLIGQHRQTRAAGIDGQPTNFNEMIMMKQKLLSRSHSQIDVK